MEEESYAVACINTVGNPEATQVKFFASTFDIYSMDDASLANLEITPSDWELADWEEGWYDAEEIYDGMMKQSCVVFQQVDTTEARRQRRRRRNLQYEADYNYDDYYYEEDEYTYESESFGTYEIVSGVRYNYFDESSQTEIEFDFEDGHWEVYYRAPEEAPELNVQVQG